MGFMGNNYLTAEPYLEVNGQPGTVLTGIMQNLRVSLRNPLSRILSCLHFSPPLKDVADEWGIVRLRIRWFL